MLEPSKELLESSDTQPWSCAVPDGPQAPHPGAVSLGHSPPWPVPVYEVTGACRPEPALSESARDQGVRN